MNQNIRRIEYLRGQVEFLTAQKNKLIALANFGESREAREIWAARLDSTIERLRKHSAELAILKDDD